ncbi:MAG: hypothetical protein HN348_04165 [Proteobacteria bacterium]|nr:hypothetical protein [Pseudomonadota bacterium]
MRLECQQKLQFWRWVFPKEAWWKRRALLVFWVTLGCACDPLGCSTSLGMDTQETTSVITGRWRMITEEPADGGGRFFKQGRRLLELRDDGSFHQQNYVYAADGQWSVEEGHLILQSDRYELVKLPIGGLDEEQLVLIEALSEAYRRDGPPRKLKITYRRVSEAELGPMLGASLAPVAPTAGSYASNFKYRMSKYPTMEIHVGKSIDGSARLELVADGTATACFGITKSDSFSESHYSSSDGQDHFRDDERRWLYGARGRWVVDGAKGTVKLDEVWRGSCDPPDDESNRTGPIELECTFLVANEVLPTPTLACRIEKDIYGLKEIAINPADTERCGPYTLQSEPMGHFSTDHGRPWLLLGQPGLVVKSQDDKNTSQPKIVFEAKKTEFLERRYLEE